MKRIFLDTNVIIDLLSNREGATCCARILSESKKKSVEVFVSVLSIVNITYILRKTLKGDAMYQALENLNKYYSVVGESSEYYKKALSLRPKDFEDSIQYFCALEKNCDAIVSRNIKDFDFAELPLFKPEEILTIIQDL